MYVKKLPYIFITALVIYGCTSNNPREKRTLDSLARVDSTAKADNLRTEQLKSIRRNDSIAIANGTRDPEAERAMAEAMWMQGDPEAQSEAFRLKIKDDTIVVRRIEYEALNFSFPGGQEYISEEEIRGFAGTDWLEGGVYTFRVTPGECSADDINSNIQGFDETYTKEINGRQFTIATGGIGGRDEINYYVCYISLDGICVSFLMEARRSLGGIDNYDALVTQYENFIASLKFR